MAGRQRKGARPKSPKARASRGPERRTKVARREATKPATRASARALRSATPGPRTAGGRMQTRGERRREATSGASRRRSPRGVLPGKAAPPPRG